VLGLEDDHEVEGAANSERHAVGEGALTHRVDEEDSRRCGNRRAVSNADPRAHSQAVAQLPLTTHPAEDAHEEVEDNQLVRTAVVEPLIQAGCVPNGIEVQADGVGGGDNCTGDDVVAIE